MRPVVLGQPASKQPEAWKKWVEQCFAELERASQEDMAAVAADFTVTNHTATRSLDAAAATLDDVRNVLATLLEDLQNRGMKRSQ